MKKPTQSQTWIGLAFAILTAATSYLGVDKYQQGQAPINIKIESAKPDNHNYSPDIRAAILAHKQADH